MLLICEIFRGMEAIERFGEGWKGKEYRITPHGSPSEVMCAFTFASNMTSTMVMGKSFVFGAPRLGLYCG
jgi:hypothetical protein